MEREVFCPFVNGECRDDCMFNNGCGDYPGDSQGCNLHDAIGVIQQIGTVKADMDSIEQKLDEIRSAIPDNYTYNSYSTLDDIHKEVKKIGKSIEKAED